MGQCAKSKTYGIDTEATFAPFRGVTLHAAVNYTRTEITDAGGLHLDGFGTAINYNGHPFSYAPKISGVFGAKYRRNVRENMEGFIGIDGSYQGQQSGDLSAEPEFNIPGYALFDVRTGFQTPAAGRQPFG